MPPSSVELSKAPATFGKAEDHLNVRDSRVIELRPVREKAGAFVKADGVRLGVEHDVRIGALPRCGDEGIEECAADAMTATVSQHRHATDLHAAIGANVEASGTDGLRVDER